MEGGEDLSNAASRNTLDAVQILDQLKGKCLHLKNYVTYHNVVRVFVIPRQNMSALLIFY